MTKRGSRRSVIIQIVLFGIVTACCLVRESQFFGGECCFYLQSLHTSTLKTRAACSSETLVSVIYKTARCHNPDDYSSSLSTLFNVVASLEKHCPLAGSLRNRCSTSTSLEHSEYANAHVSGFSTTTISHAPSPNIRSSLAHLCSKSSIRRTTFFGASHYSGTR